MRARLVGSQKLNELSREIGTKTENAWVNWFYRDEQGIRRPVSDMRDQNRILSRGPSRKSEASRREDEEAIPGTESGSQNINKSWREIIRDALQNLGGTAPLEDIYTESKRLRLEAGGSVTREFEATIRRTLEDNSSDSENFRSDDWFEMPEGKGQGIWALRHK